ncbi:MAG TPA: biotin/lipoyl-containing protein [Vicinamibacterales bacterium]|nr:biotin/lipoyl-containing protein [Vicinamibacterales bacterium]
MQYDVVIGPRTRKVIVQRAGEAWRVTVDGAPFAVLAARVDGVMWSLLVGQDGAAGMTRSVPAVVVPGPARGQLGVHVNGRQITVAITESGRARVRGGRTAHGQGPQRLTAPMPGKIVKLLVAPGDTVEAGQGLVVVEAMKMENELRAAKAGRVTSVSVTEGQSVDAGAVLAVVE